MGPWDEMTTFPFIWSAIICLLYPWGEHALSLKLNEGMPLDLCLRRERRIGVQCGPMLAPGAAHRCSVCLMNCFNPRSFFLDGAGVGENTGDALWLPSGLFQPALIFS
jgi:hypothetical protein